MIQKTTHACVAFLLKELNMKLLKYISVVLASSAFCSNSLVGAITDEEFEKYREFDVTVSESAAKCVKLNDEKGSLYMKILNIKIGKDEFVFDPIKKISGGWKMSLEMWSRLLIYRIICRMKLKTSNTNEQKFEGFDKTENILIFEGFDKAGNILLFEDFDKTENILIRSEESERFKEVIYKLFDCFKLTGFVEGKYSSNIDFNIFCTNYLSRSFDRMAECMFDNSDLSNAKKNIKARTLIVFYELILRGSFTSSRMDFNTLKKVANNPEEYQSKKEMISEIFKKGHDGRIEFQKDLYKHDCEVFGCKEIMKDPIKYYLDNKGIVESFIEALIKFVEVLEK